MTLLLNSSTNVSIKHLTGKIKRPLDLLLLIILYKAIRNGKGEENNGPHCMHVAHHAKREDNSSKE